MNPYHLIGLTGIAENDAGERVGSAHVGKDEIGAYLCQYKSFVRESFAGPIYAIAEHAFGIPKAILDNPTKFQKEAQIYQPWNMTLREILQTVGTELFRDHVDADFWVKRLDLALSDLTHKTVVTDVRMGNEADLIRRRGGTVIHVHRKLGEQGKVRPHRSEGQVEIKPEDAHIYNYGTLQDLYTQIDEVILSQL